MVSGRTNWRRRFQTLVQSDLHLPLTHPHTAPEDAYHTFDHLSRSIRAHYRRARRAARVAIQRRPVVVEASEIPVRCLITQASSEL